MKPKRFKVKVLGRRSGVVKDYITTVDAEDAPLMRSSYWTVVRGRDVKGVERAYIARQTTNGHEFLHHVVLGAGPSEPVMHINGESLDNRKANLFRRSERIEEIE